MRTGDAFACRFVDASSSPPRAAFSVLGILAAVEEPEAVSVEWAGGWALFNVRDASFLYADPAEALDEAARARASEKFVAGLQADWSDGSRALFIALR